MTDNDDYGYDDGDDDDDKNNNINNRKKGLGYLFYFVYILPYQSICPVTIYTSVYCQYGMLFCLYLGLCDIVL